MQARAVARSAPLYDYIDTECDGFYKNKVQPKYRSRINITFRVKGGDSTLETKFVQEAEARGLLGLAGHAWVGGLRVTLNNHMPFEAVYTLIDFMKGFKARYS